MVTTPKDGNREVMMWSRLDCVSKWTKLETESGKIYIIYNSLHETVEISIAGRKARTKVTQNRDLAGCSTTEKKIYMDRSPARTCGARQLAPKALADSAIRVQGASRLRRFLWVHQSRFHFFCLSFFFDFSFHRRNSCHGSSKKN